MPYDPGAQGVTLLLHSDELVAPDEEGQRDASSEIAGFPTPPARHRLLAGWRGGGRCCKLPGEGDGKAGRGWVNTAGRFHGLP